MVTPEDKLKAAAAEYRENPKHYMPGFKPMGRIDDAFLAGARWQAVQADEELESERAEQAAMTCSKHRRLGCIYCFERISG